MLQRLNSATQRSDAAALFERGNAMNPRVQRWQGMRVWLIGASAGIGAETARLLMQKGAWVALSARNQSALSALAETNEQALVLPLDVSQHAQVLAARLPLGGHPQSGRSHFL